MSASLSLVTNRVLLRIRLRYFVFIVVMQLIGFKDGIEVGYLYDIVGLAKLIKKLVEETIGGRVKIAKKCPMRCNL